jgi:hypothetical protein
VSWLEIIDKQLIAKIINYEIKKPQIIHRLMKSGILWLIKIRQAYDEASLSEVLIVH